MPHKRAKQSVRVKVQAQKGTDHAPGKQSLENEAIPKSLARVLNAATIRADWKKSGRKMDDDGERLPANKRRKVEEDDGKKSKKSSGKEKTKALSIKPGESLQHFNRRVEDDMRPLVKSAVQSSLSTARNVQKAEMEAKAQEKKKKAALKRKVPDDDDDEDEIDDTRSPSPAPLDKHADRPKEFQTISSSAPRRLNDIAQAPPEFKKVPKGIALSTGRQGGGKETANRRDGVLSMAQKAMMEEEREKAILRYRQMKAQRSGNDEGSRG